MAANAIVTVVVAAAAANTERDWATLTGICVWGPGVFVLAGVPFVAQQQMAELARGPEGSSHPGMVHGTAEVSAGMQGARIVAMAPRTSAVTFSNLNIVGKRYTRIPNWSNDTGSRDDTTA